MGQGGAGGDHSHTNENLNMTSNSNCVEIGIVIIGILTLNWNCFHPSSKRHGRMSSMLLYKFSLGNFFSCANPMSTQWQRLLWIFRHLLVFVCAFFSSVLFV